MGPAGAVVVVVDVDVDVVVDDEVVLVDLVVLDEDEDDVVVAWELDEVVDAVTSSPSLRVTSRITPVPTSRTSITSNTMIAVRPRPSLGGTLPSPVPGGGPDVGGSGGGAGGVAAAPTTGVGSVGNAFPSSGDDIAAV